MSVAGQTGDAPAAARPGALRAFRIVVHVIPAFILVQAFLAGRGQFIDRDLLDVHGYIGIGTGLLVVAQAVLAFLVGFQGRQRRASIGSSIAMLVLVTVQLGLGYSGRDGHEAAAWHLANGVLIFGLAVANVSLALRAGRP